MQPKHAHENFSGLFLPKREDVSVCALLVGVISCEPWREEVPCVVVVTAGGWQGCAVKGANDFWW